jgi:hypothetical protein
MLKTHLATPSPANGSNHTAKSSTCFILPTALSPTLRGQTAWSLWVGIRTHRLPCKQSATGLHGLKLLRCPLPKAALWDLRQDTGAVHLVDLRERRSQKGLLGETIFRLLLSWSRVWPRVRAFAESFTVYEKLGSAYPSHRAVHSRSVPCK